MANPVTGPYTKAWVYVGPPNTLGFAPPWLTANRTWYRQKAPFTEPLPFTYYAQKVDTFWCTEGVVYARADIGSISPSFDGIPHALNKAYSKLVEAVGDQSLWAVNGAEGRKAMTMIASDATKLWKFVRALHRFDFTNAALILKMDIPKGLKPKAKAFGSNFLKFHFGWEPLVKDIGAAVSTLCDPIPPKKVKGKGVHHSNSRVTNDVNGGFVRWTDVTYAKTETVISVESPNLHLAQQLGFVNPLAVAWELVPFSFVFDWIFNVGQVLGHMTDFAGLLTKDAYRTVHVISKGTATSLPGRPDVGYNVTYTGIYTNRLLGLPIPTLVVRPWKGVSPVRAATAISLLLGALKSK